jgi:hypothetical protein
MLVAQNENLPVAAAASALPEFIEKSDLVIPKIKLIQKMSEEVDKGLAKAGDLFDTMENKVVGSEGNPLEIIPLHNTKFFWMMDAVKNGKFIGVETYSPDKANWRYDQAVKFYDKKENKMVDAYPTLVVSWFCLLVKELEEMGGGIPVRIDFKSTSLETSKKLSTLITKGTFFKLPVFGRTYKLKVTKESNDKGTWNNLDVEVGTLVKKEWLDMAASFASMFQSKPSEVLVDSGFEDVTGQV